MNLKNLQKQSNLTINQTAKELNLPVSTFNNYLRETRQPDIKTLCKLADYYQVSVDYLLGHETKHLIDTSMWSETKKGVIFALDQLTEQNSLILLGYVTHMLKQQNS